jgi:hypothetical protein
MKQTKKVQGKRAYDKVRHLTEVPLKKRAVIKNMRGVQVIPRRYHETEKSALKAKKNFLELKSLVPNTESEKLVDSNFYIPYRPYGPYYGSVMALYLLGANKYHSFCAVRDMMKEFMSKLFKNKEESSSWDKFSNKDPREFAESRAHDANARIADNFSVLQRLGGHNPCGYKLAEIGCCIDIQKHVDGKTSYCLNTHFDMKTMEPLLDNVEFLSERKKHREMIKRVKKSKDVIDKMNNEVINDLLEKRKEETTFCKSEG